MKRLTSHELDNYNEPGCNNCSAYCYECCVQDNYVKNCIRRLTWIRLSEIEDILGDNYDLQMLKNYFTFNTNYPIVSEYNPKDEDGLYTKTITGVITKEEYNKVKEIYNEKT